MGSLRRRYPAQELRVGPAPQTNGTSNGHMESEDEDMSSHPEPHAKPKGRANSHKRRSYPLQRLSTPQLRAPQQQQQQSQMLEEESECEAQTSGNAPSPAKHGSMRRRYPAQRLAVQPSPQTNGYHRGDDHADTAVSPTSSSVPSRANSGRRRPYPAQALPVDRLPRIEPSRDNLRDEDSLQQTPAVSQHGSERKIFEDAAMSQHSSENAMLEKGRRRAYPSQTLPVDRLPHPKPSREDLSATLQAEAFPSCVHAVKDAETMKGRAGRTIVVCLDGTGDQFDNDNSNIVHFVECLKKDDPSQVTYYQPGIGTYGEGQKLSAGFTAALDMAVGSHLGVHICDAYRFLMATYQEGDRICLFGFSRGAYTARCLAGMIHKVGLLPAHNGAQVPFAYKQYKDETTEGWAMSAQFKQTFCNDVRVYFIGVFDSVASVGFIPRKLPLSSNPHCQAAFFRHAMALDEHRAKFKVARYQKTAQSAVEKGLVEVRHNDPETDVLEVWFAGCHADVGGGAVANSERHMLSRIPLRWIIRQCFECDTGVLFQSSALAEKGLDVHTLFPQYTRLTRPSVGPPPSLINKYEEGSLGPLTRRSTALESRNASITSNPFADPSSPRSQPQTIPDMIPEQAEDYFDALARCNDQLVDAYWKWAFLEFWPIKVKTLDAHTGKWIKSVRPNLMRYRNVPETEPLMHWTVRQRMESMGYKTKVRTAPRIGWRIVV